MYICNTHIYIQEIKITIIKNEKMCPLQGDGKI